MGKRRRRQPSRRTRRQAQKQRLERRESHRWLIQNGLAVVMILISAKTCQYAERDHMLTRRVARLEAQLEQSTASPANLSVGASGTSSIPFMAPSNIRITLSK